uniref:Uncharacterized protein n=1 Tax=Aplanochytrium stocchinoi TaxID=215587 RepID=A0A7S3V1X8_9STRA
MEAFRSRPRSSSVSMSMSEDSEFLWKSLYVFITENLDLSEDMPQWPEQESAYSHSPGKPPQTVTVTRKYKLVVDAGKRVLFPEHTGSKRNELNLACEIIASHAFRKILSDFLLLVFTTSHLNWNQIGGKLHFVHILEILCEAVFSHAGCIRALEIYLESAYIINNVIYTLFSSLK